MIANIRPTTDLENNIGAHRCQKMKGRQDNRRPCDKQAYQIITFTDNTNMSTCLDCTGQICNEERDIELKRNEAEKRTRYRNAFLEYQSAGRLLNLLEDIRNEVVVKLGQLRDQGEILQRQIAEDIRANQEIIEANDNPADV